MTCSRARLFGATSLIAVSTLVTSAQGQETNPDTTDDTFLGTLILGELQTRTVQESATSAAIERGEELETRGDGDVYNVVERTPNVSTTYGNKGFVLRGIQTNGAVSNVQLNGTLVSVQVDGVALNNYQSTFFGPYSSWDIEQVEVLRGPQSTQQGRNALAGAVIINTKDPVFVPEYRFRLETASRNTQRAAVAINQPLSETLAFRFAAEGSSTDGWVESEPRDDDKYDARSYESYRAKLRWQPSDVFDAVLEYSYTDSRGGEDYVEEEEFPKKRSSKDTTDAEEGSVHRNLGLSTTYNISPAWTLETRTNWYNQDYTRLEGDDPNAFGVFDLERSFRDFSSESRTFEQDIQLKYEGPTVQGVVGLFYTETSDTRPSYINTDLSVASYPGFTDFFREDFETDVTNYAIYGEADIAVNEKLTLTIGARYDVEEYSFKQSLDFGPLLNGVAGIPDIDERSGSQQFEAFLPKFGLTYDFTPDQSVSFTAQKGYRAGGVSSNLVETLIPGENPLSEYDPEFSTNYELAYRGSFNDDRVQVQANLFYTHWTDMQISVPGTPSGTALDALFNNDTANAAESELWGLEASFQAEASKNLDLFGSIGYTETRFIDFDDDPTTPGDLNGKQFPFAPQWTASLGGKYNWNNGFSLGVDASFKGASYQDNENTYKDDERLLWNAHATYDINENFTAGLYVRNITDEQYATARFESSDPLVRTGEPRTVGFYLQAEF
ncbi:MAG: TonB-dependent receptor [Marinovum sp.]|nr:TonB-dependent receptor [Marinovum sp.]